MVVCICRCLSSSERSAEKLKALIIAQNKLYGIVLMLHTKYTHILHRLSVVESLLAQITVPQSSHRDADHRRKGSLTDIESERLPLVIVWSIYWLPFFCCTIQQDYSHNHNSIEIAQIELGKLKWQQQQYGINGIDRVRRTIGWQSVSMKNPLSHLVSYNAIVF